MEVSKIVVCRVVSFSSAHHLVVPDDTVVKIDCHGASLELFSTGGNSVSLGKHSSLSFRHCYLQAATPVLDTTAPGQQKSPFLDVQGPNTSAVVLEQSQVQLPCQVCTAHDYCSTRALEIEARSAYNSCARPTLTISACSKSLVWVSRRSRT